jgi:hypothetical protein
MVAFFVYAVKKYGEEHEIGIQNPDNRFNREILRRLVYDLDNKVFIDNSGKLDKGIDNKELRDGLNFNIRQGFKNADFNDLLEMCKNYCGEMENSLSFPNISEWGHSDSNEDDFWKIVREKFAM